MGTGTAQKTLSRQQIENFYHDEFVEDQIRHFTSLARAGARSDKVVVDVGGGCGFFAKRLAHLADLRVRVVDTDPASIEACRRLDVDAIQGDALAPPIMGDEGLACFNLILHHLVGASEAQTRQLQRSALTAWRFKSEHLFVNEYIYESFFGDFSGWLILQVTKNRLLSKIGQVVSIFLPSLRANTFGVGVRFRSHDQWRRLFREAGYEVTSSRRGQEEFISWPRRLLLIRKIRRDSFLLTPV